MVGCRKWIFSGAGPALSASGPGLLSKEEILASVFFPDLM